MPSVEYILEKDAPSPPKALSKLATQALEILQSIKVGQVARLSPDDGQTVRSLRTSMTRASKKQGVKILAYEATEEPGVLFVKKTK